MNRNTLAIILIGVILFSGFPSNLQAQPGVVRISTNPTAKTVVYNDTILVEGNTMRLPQGSYNIKAWYPGMKILDTLVTVIPNEIVFLRHDFVADEEYLEFLAEYKSYTKQRDLKFTLPLGGVILSSGALAFTHFYAKTIQQRAQQEYDNYRYASAANVDELKSTFLETQKLYKGLYISQYVEYTALAVSAFYLIKGIKWMNKNDKPDKRKYENPLILQSVGVAPLPNNNIGLNLVIGF